MEEKLKVISLPKKAEVPKVQAYVLKSGKFIWRESMKQADIAIKDNIISRQLPLEKFNYGVDGAFTPPFEPEALIRCLEMSTVHYRCVKAKAFDVAGGYYIKAVEGIEKPNEAEQEQLQEFFNTCGGNESFLEILERTLIDFESIGYAGMEVARNRKGLPSNIWQMAASTFRFLKDENLILQKRGINKVYFQKFPLKYDREIPKWNLYDPYTGKTTSKLSVLDAANEVMTFSNYHPRSERYGEPDFVPSAGAIVGNVYARDYNLDDFAESMIPAYAVLVSGASVGPDVQKLVEQYFEDIRASGRNTLIISVPGKNVKIELKELQTAARDQSFTQFKKDNRDEIMLAHGMHPARIGIIETAQLGAGSGMSQLIHYKSGVIEPRQRWLEHRINHMLVRMGFGITDWEFAFIDLDIADKKEECDILTRYVSAGIMDENEARAKLGLPEKAISKEPKSPSFMMSLKQMGSHLKTELFRKQFKAGLRAAWKKAALPKPAKVKAEGDQPTWVPPPVDPILKEMENKLMTVAELLFPSAIQELADTIAEESEVEFTDEDVAEIEDEITDKYHDYIMSAWIPDFGKQLESAYALADEGVIADLVDKTEQRMSSRAGLYAGLMFTALALLTARAALKKDKLVYWRVADDDACEDCLELATGSPYKPDELEQYPGDGTTKCHGNCRCILAEEE